ncbi:MAG: flippase [Verrucomicrobia bacterium]|nr:flippase [Verrucomicrobiota bacterium]
MNLKELRDRLGKSLIARNTLWMLMGHFVRVGLQAVYFVMIARSLGADGYGAFVGVAALACIFAPFASFGSGNILIKNVARDPSTFARCWGNALLITLVSAGLLVAVLMVVARLMMPASISWVLVLTIAVAELVFARLLDVAGQAFQAFQRLNRTAQFQVLMSVMRVAAVLLLYLTVAKPTAEAWGVFYLVSTAITSAVAVWLVHRELGKAEWSGRGVFSEMKEGFYFSVSLSAQNIYNDIDKTMLTRYSTLDATGIYGAAYRLIEIAMTPVRSLLYAAYAKFFQHGASGVRGGLAFARRFVPMAGGYGLFAALVLCLGAPVVPMVLGPEFERTVEATRWLSLLPFLKTLHYFGADTLTCSGHQGLRSGIQVVVAVFNVLSNLWIIPLYSWRGAAWTSLASDSLLTVLVWTAVWWQVRKSPPVPPADAAPCEGDKS